MYKIYTDGACFNNPGPGGWAVVVNNQVELSGSYYLTTNNRMEMMAVIMGLANAKSEYATLYTDSKYIADAINSNWIKKWRKNGWKTAKKTDVKNKDLWLRIIENYDSHKHKIVWVKGHSNNELNCRCDALAKSAIDYSVKMKDVNYERSSNEI